MAANSLNVRSLKGYIDAGLNVIISGIHGVGKTAKLREAVDQLGLSMKYYSASTLDPYTDLTGVPVPNMETKTIEYFRPRDIDEAEVLFFDEINRADPKTINAIFEITQFGTINGEKLPKLKCVIAAMNPVSEEYTTDELDVAFLDRFDIFLEAPAAIDAGYFVKKFGDRLGSAAVKVWEEYETSRNSRGVASVNAIPYISPRRMDKITAAFKAIPSRQTILDALPAEITDKSWASTLYRAFDAATKEPKVAEANDTTSQVNEIIMSSISEQRSAATGKKVSELINSGKLSAQDRGKLLTSLATALNSAKSPATLEREFGDALRAMDATQWETLHAGWAPSKLRGLQELIARR